MCRYVRGYIATRSLVLTLALALLLFALNLPASGGPDRNIIAPVLPWYSWSTVRLFVFRRAAQEWSLSSGIEQSKFEGSFRHFFTISRYRCIGLSEAPEPSVLAHHRLRLSTTRCWQNADQTRSLARRVASFCVDALFARTTRTGSRTRKTLRRRRQKSHLDHRRHPIFLRPAPRVAAPAMTDALVSACNRPLHPFSRKGTATIVSPHEGTRCEPRSV